MAAGAPDPEALLAEVWQELRRIARAQLSRERPGHTLQPTALVNEAYLKLRTADPAVWRARGDLVAVASRAMKQVLVDHARRKGAQKRQDGGEPLDWGQGVAGPPPFDIVALDEALDRLRLLSPRQCEVVQRRVLAGYSLEEIAEALDTSVRTVQRDWRLARAWLRKELELNLDLEVP